MQLTFNFLTALKTSKTTIFLSFCQQGILIRTFRRRLIWWFIIIDNTECALLQHDDVIKWKHFPRYWTFVRGIHRFPVNSTHKGQWRGALMFSLICVWINGEAGDLRRHRAHYDVTVMKFSSLWLFPCPQKYQTSGQYLKLLATKFCKLCFFFESRYLDILASGFSCLAALQHLTQMRSLIWRRSSIIIPRILTRGSHNSVISFSISALCCSKGSTDNIMNWNLSAFTFILLSSNHLIAFLQSCLWFLKMMLISGEEYMIQLSSA